MQSIDCSMKKLPSNITLIGMAGVGKSVIGKRLAETLHYEFIDVDERIERQLKLPLQEIVNRLGEQGFLRNRRRDDPRTGVGPSRRYLSRGQCRLLLHSDGVPERKVSHPLSRRPF